MDNLQLVEQKGVLALLDTRHPEFAPISVEFPSHLRQARQRSELGGQPLIRAIGNKTETVIDATAGMGQDSIAMAVHGFRVTGYERSGEIARLLANGLERIMHNPDEQALVGDRLQFIHADAIEVLAGLSTPPQAIYMDPMYPPKRKKSALSKKEMQLFRKVVGEDVDADKLFEVASAVATERVVVKRPRYAEPVGGQPSMSYEGKLVRFDVDKVN